MEEKRIFLKSFPELAQLGYIVLEGSGNESHYRQTEKCIRYKAALIESIRSTYGWRDVIDFDDPSIISPIFMLDRNGSEFLPYSAEELDAAEKKAFETMMQKD
jgi:hypothetical protein